MNLRCSAILIAGLLLGVAAPALAQSPDAGSSVDEARSRALALNKAGAALSAKKDWAGALDKFQQAYAVFPSPKVLKNIGEMLKEMGRFADAANVYQRWLDDPGAESARRAEVTKILATLDQSLGVLLVSALPDGVEVQVDGWNPSWLAPSQDPTWRPIEQAGRVRVPAGSFTVRARKAGFVPAQVTGTVAAAGTQTVVLELVEELDEVVPVDEPVVTEPVEDPARTRAPGATTPSDGPAGGTFTSQRKIAVGVGAVSVLGLAGGIVLGMQASSLQDDAYQLCPSNPCGANAEAGNALIDRAHTRSLYANISFGVAGVAAVTAAILWLTGAPDDDRAQRVAIDPVIAPGLAGLSVAVRY